MKAILEFNLPEEECQYYNAIKGSEFRFSAQEYASLLRNRIKHGEFTDEELEIFNWCRDTLYKTFNENGLTIFD